MSVRSGDGAEIGLTHSLKDALGEALDDPRVLAVVQEYQAELDLGRAPDRQTYLNRHAELKVAISQCLDGLDLVRAAGPRSTSGAANRGVGGEPPRALGDFQIIRELGRGGMAVVYEAMQLSLGRRVALKVLPFAATFDARQLQRFKNEAQAAALLHHTSIVPIYAVGCERGVHFYAMQLIEGQSLALLIRQLREQAGLATADAGGQASSRGGDSATGPFLGGVVPAPALTSEQLRSTAGASINMTARAPRGNDAYYQKIARLALQAADALEHAQQAGIVHRDIKPANLLVDAAGALWVADFGLAQFQADAGLTRTGDLLGTFRYMSPEQAGGQRNAVDHRTDLYSLGATFYELLTLEPVFTGDTRHELLFQILHEEPRAPRTVNRAIPFELETIALKALRKTPAERYASAAELAEDLRRFLDNRPILARRPTLVDRLRKWSRRHPSAVVAGALLLAFSLAALSVSNRMIAREQQKTADALEREKLRANEAEELFRQARQAVDVLVEVSEEELAESSGAIQTRKRLLQTALGFYQDFIDQRRGDAASQADLAAVEQRVKGILRELDLLRRDIQTMLLRKPLVTHELRLDEEQNEQVAQLLRRWDEERQKLFSDHDLEEEDRRRRFVALAEDREQSLAQALTAQQLHRLRQLMLQWQGLWAFKEPEVAAALGLTSEQRAAIRKIERERFGRGADHGREPGGGREPNGDREHRRERGPHDRGPRPPDFQQAVSKVFGLLTPEQLQRWQELTGTPVDGLQDAPGGRPRRPPPPDEGTRKPRSLRGD